MELLDYQQNKIYNEKEEKKLENLSNKVYNYIQQFIDNDLKVEYDKKNKNMVVIKYIRDNDYKNTYFVKYNNKFHEIKSSAAATAQYMVQQYDKEQKVWNFKPGIAISNNSEHNIIHEMVHYYSYPRQIPIRKGLLFNKKGFSCNVYNENDTLINTEFSNAFLTEGITESLASNINDDEPHAYLFNVVVSDILNINDNSITKIYFSHNPKDLIIYKKNFEKLTNSKFENIFNLEINKNYDKGTIENILKLCIKYKLENSKSIIETEEIKENLINYFKNKGTRVEFLKEKNIDVGSIINYITSYKKDNEINMEENDKKRNAISNFISKYKYYETKQITIKSTEELLKELNNLKQNLDNSISKKVVDYLSKIENVLIENYNQSKISKENVLEPKEVKIKNKTKTSIDLMNSEIYLNKLKRALSKKEELLKKPTYDEELLMSCLRDFENLSNELYTIQIGLDKEQDYKIKQKISNGLKENISKLRLIVDYYNPNNLRRK